MLHNIMHYTFGLRLASVGIVFLSGCGSSTRVAQTATSPDSLIDAVVYADGGGGATVGYFYEIKLQPRGSGSGHGLNVFDGYALSCLGVGWEGQRTLVIRYNDSRGQGGLSRTSPVALSYGGPRAVEVRLEHGPTFVRESDERLACASDALWQPAAPLRRP